MPGQILGLFSGQTNTPNPKRPDRWLNFQYGWPPESNIRDREDAPGQANPYNLWIGGSVLGGEETGLWPFQLTCFDDDIRFGGRKGPTVVAGQTVDSAGSPLPGMKVELWLIAPLDVGDGPQKQPQFVASIYSNADGLFAFTVPNTTDLYKVEAYDGSRSGVTVRNLTGA